MQTIKHVREYELPIKIAAQTDGGFVVTCPIWKDCYAQGESVDEAILEITAVAQSLIELYNEEGLRIPHHKEIKSATLKSIVKQMGITEKKFTSL